MCLGVTLVVALCLTFGYSSGQDTEKGEATIEIKMKMDDFLSYELQWRDTMAWYASKHCKKSKDNCWTEDKQIRYHDVIITSKSGNVQSTEVKFYIRDRYDHNQAGIASQQVRAFFLEYETDIEKEFGNKEMTLLSPEDEGMKAWLIAVIVICSVVGVVLIVTVTVLAVKQHKYKKEKKRRDEIRNQLHEYNLTGDLYLPEGKLNPVFTTDNDNPRSSATDSELTKSLSQRQSTQAVKDKDDDQGSTAIVGAQTSGNGDVHSDQELSLRL